MSLRMTEGLTQFISLYPEHLLLGLSVLCLFVFLLTIPLPRVDNQLVGSDGVRYYAYLPSLLLDGDLDLTDEYTYFFAYEPSKAEQIISNPTSRGVPPNQWPVGPAILWAPFFLLAHLLTHLFNLLGANIPTNGYGYFYQAFVLSGSVLYGGAGLLLTYRFVRELATEEAALVATALIAFSGNLVYYVTAEPSMPHALSAFASGLFFYTWGQRRNQPGVKTAVLYGLLGGLMALIRPQDGLFLALPFYGDYFRSPYTYHAGTKFSWLSPRLGAVLFSAFSWAVHLASGLPASTSGFAARLPQRPCFRRRGSCGFCDAVVCHQQLAQLDSRYAFGGRMFIVCTPIFALGLACFIEWMQRRWTWEAVYVVGGLLLVWNFLLFVEYRLDLVTAQRPPTWYDLGVRRVTFLLEVLGRTWR